MNSVVIGSLREVLAKPGLSPRAREIAEARLKYWQGKQTKHRDTTRAVEKSANNRRMAARRKYRIVRPMILRLQGEGLTGKEIVIALREARVTNLRGKPYGLGGIQYIMRMTQ